ncbi:MAG: phenylalanine--tRNA ligase subunit alpha [Oscillospiraceae bacterium]|nr:phenylalanine--tRNA ligase subunit alpha [Oscillospiraceae bacterium]
MDEQMRMMQQEIETAAASITDSKEMYLLRKQYLDNKTGRISALMKNMRDLAPEERPAFGKVVNELKQWALDFFTAQDARLKAAELAQKNAAEQIDVTMPAPVLPAGALHPNTLIVNELIDIFAGMGFTIFEGPEIENDYYNFTALNTPADHPARDMQDTFYITEELLLRTQTSAGQIRVMENAQPPIKILSPGKVFRSDDDATHSPMFSQMEGLVVDKGITLCDLQGMLDVFAQRIFGEQVKTRLRPSYFPFTEPSVEVDVSCFACGGKGCRLCKDTGWIEVLGAGMVNRHVLENCGLDPDVYTGFAFGMGVERIAMLKYGINNIKLLFESDVRVLEQFRG